jgi:hypothetical protein
MAINHKTNGCPPSSDLLDEKHTHRNAEQGRKDKNGKPLKFRSDLESD